MTERFAAFGDYGKPNKKKRKELGELTTKVFEAICNEWPANPNEIALFLNENGKSKSLSAKYIYHFKKLEKANLIRLKKVGHTFIAWPNDMEKLRIVHEMVRD